jgi:hypothetical protein
VVPPLNIDPGGFDDLSMVLIQKSKTCAEPETPANKISTN